MSPWTIVKIVNDVTIKNGFDKQSFLWDVGLRKFDVIDGRGMSAVWRGESRAPLPITTHSRFRADVARDNLIIRVLCTN